MIFPKRWLDDDSEATIAMRDVLRADSDMDPPDGAERAVWIGLMAKVGAAGAGAAAAGAAAKAAAGASAKTAAAAGGAGVIGGGLLKSILIGAFSGVVAITGYSALEASRGAAPEPAPESVAPAPTSAAPDVKATPSSAAAAPAMSAEKAAPSAPRGASSPAPAAPHSDESAAPASAPEPAAAADAAGAAAPAPGTPEERASRLREENAMLAQARAAMRSGDTGGAMRMLEEARQKFPDGVLGQEREALTIETLAKSGAKGAASARAAAFIKAHPTSPHAARLQAFVHE